MIHAVGTIWRARTLPAVLLALLCGLAVVTVALAHAAYDKSTPGQGQTVQTSPARVDIYTKQDMKKEQGAYNITVVRNDNGTGGQRVDTGGPAIDDADRKHFSVGLQPNLPAGRYVVSFNNVSDEDGEADGGMFAFYVGAGPTAAQKALDAKLAITSQNDEAKKSDSHTGLIIGIVVAVVVALLVLGGGGFYLRSRRAA